MLDHRVPWLSRLGFVSLTNRSVFICLRVCCFGRKARNLHSSFCYLSADTKGTGPFRTQLQNIHFQCIISHKGWCITCSVIYYFYRKKLCGNWCDSPVVNEQNLLFQIDFCQYVLQKIKLRFAQFFI